MQVLITAVIVALLVFGISSFFGRGVSEVKKANILAHERCKATGKTTSQYSYEIQKALVKGEQQEAKKKYVEFQKCFPKKEPAIACRYLLEVNRDAKVCE